MRSTPTSPPSAFLRSTRETLPRATKVSPLARSRAAGSSRTAPTVPTERLRMCVKGPVEQVLKGRRLGGRQGVKARILKGFKVIFCIYLSCIRISRSTNHLLKIMRACRTPIRCLKRARLRQRRSQAEVDQMSCYATAFSPVLSLPLVTTRYPRCTSPSRRFTVFSRFSPRYQLRSTVVTATYELSG